MSKKVEVKPSAYVYPAPVVLITSIGENERPNIMTSSWVANVSGKQLVVSLASSSYSNGLIRESGEFVVNLPTVDILRETDHCGMVSGRSVDKFSDTKLTPVKAKKVRPPLIAECPINIECKVKNTIELGSQDLFIGEVLSVELDESILDEKKRIDPKKLRAISWSPQTLEYYSLGGQLGSGGLSLKK
jgi:flavin reductase (DIM6/NTAB) family NADH-FMN oxidoreductase RutF